MVNRIERAVWPRRYVIIAVACGLVLLGAAGLSFATLAIYLMIATAFCCGLIFADWRWNAQARDLHGRVSRFMKTGHDDGQTTPHTLSSGMADLHLIFEKMMQMGAADDVIAQQSHADRSVLIREVHHRVKNNLQLISSILSIHIREVPDDATLHILRRIQNRVNSLGTVHTDIYQHSSSGALPVARLLHEIADNAEKHALSFGQPLKIERDIKPAHLLPDQAIPLSLLVSEALDMVARLGKLQDISLHF